VTRKLLYCLGFSLLLLGLVGMAASSGASTIDFDRHPHEPVFEVDHSQRAEQLRDLIKRLIDDERFEIPDLERQAHKGRNPWLERILRHHLDAPVVAVPFVPMAALPEPSTTMLFCAGLAVIGQVSRRNRRGGHG
jgi:hypothetical protein